MKKSKENPRIEIEGLFPNNNCFNHTIWGRGLPKEKQYCENLEDVVKSIKDGTFVNPNGIYVCWGKDLWTTQFQGKIPEKPVIIFNEKLTELVASRKHWNGKEFPNHIEDFVSRINSYSSYWDPKSTIKVAYHKSYSYSNFGTVLSLLTEYEFEKKGDCYWMKVDKNIIEKIRYEKDMSKWIGYGFNEDQVKTINSDSGDKGSYFFKVRNYIGSEFSNNLLLAIIKKITPDIVKGVFQIKDGKSKIYRFE